MNKKKKGPQPAQSATLVAADAQENLRQNPIPTDEDANIREAARLERMRAGKRRGRASTLLSNEVEKSTLGSF